MHVEPIFVYKVMQALDLTTFKSSWFIFFTSSLDDDDDDDDDTLELWLMGSNSFRFC
jgi:hypothetical protein